MRTYSVMRWLLVGWWMACVVGLLAAQVVEPVKGPQVSEAVRRSIITLQMRAKGLEDAKGVLQREEDAVLAELQRQLAAAAAACGKDYDMTATLTCEKKK